VGRQDKGALIHPVAQELGVMAAKAMADLRPPAAAALALYFLAIVVVAEVR